jgi:thiamine pyrophosphokinase
MRAFIYVGGDINPDMITEHPKGDDITVAADSGYENAKRLGERVDLFVGDMDSYGGEIEEKTQIVRLKPEKDVTDTQAAFELAAERGADDIIIIGGLSGRLDHTMANLSMLEDAHARRLHCVITDGYNRVRFLKNDSTLLGRSQFRYFGLVPVEETVKGVEIKGAKYCLGGAKLSRKTVGFSVSNEIDGNCAFIAVKKGSVYIVESN